MSHLSRRANLCPQGSLRGQRDAIIRGLTVDQEAAAARISVGYLRARRVTLLADNKEQSSLHAPLAQSLGRSNLRGDDALGVARAASVDELIILARRNERRNCIGVRGEDDIRRLAGDVGIDVEPFAGAAAFTILLDWHGFNGKAPPAEKFREKLADHAFVVGDGLDVDETPRQIDRVESSNGGSGGIRQVRAHRIPAYLTRWNGRWKDPSVLVACLALQDSAVRLVSGRSLLLLQLDQSIGVVLERVTNCVFRLLPVIRSDVFRGNKSITITVHAGMKSQRAVLFDMVLWRADN